LGKQDKMNKYGDGLLFTEAKKPKHKGAF